MEGLLLQQELFYLTVAGIKTMTRRDHNLKTINKLKLPDAYKIIQIDSDDRKMKFSIANECIAYPVKPRYEIGQKLYLKEPVYFKDEIILYIYPPDQINDDEIPILKQEGYKYRNKLHLPEAWARYFIEITSVGLERLQDITDEDCFKEGIQKITDHAYGVILSDAWDETGTAICVAETPNTAYLKLFRKVSGKRDESYINSNPFVFKYEYKLVTK